MGTSCICHGVNQYKVVESQREEFITAENLHDMALISQISCSASLKGFLWFKGPACVFISDVWQDMSEAQV